MFVLVVAQRFCTPVKLNTVQRFHRITGLAMSAKSFWLLKTEPEEWSWKHQADNGGASQWDGVKNALAQKHMKAMKYGDFCFFYHTGKEKRIVGLVTVSKEWYPENPSEENLKYGLVDVQEYAVLPNPVSLKQLKDEVGKTIEDFPLFKQPRLSIVPVSEDNFFKICTLGGLNLSSEKISSDKVEEVPTKEPKIEGKNAGDLQENQKSNSEGTKQELRRSTRKRKEKP